MATCNAVQKKLCSGGQEIGKLGLELAPDNDNDLFGKGASGRERLTQFS